MRNGGGVIPRGVRKERSRMFLLNTPLFHPSFSHHRRWGSRWPRWIHPHNAGKTIPEQVDGPW